MNSRTVTIITGLIGTVFLMTFVIGLTLSVANGFAGFDGALPLIVIVAFVLALVIFDFFDQCVRNHRK